MTVFHKRLQRFYKDENAALAVEAVLIFPVLFWAYMGMYVFWDAFKMRNINLKAAYTISDMVSRQPSGIDGAYVDGMNAMLRFLNRSKYDTRLRVNMVGARLNPLDGELEYYLCWSAARGEGFQSRIDMNGLTEQIPIMAAGSEAIVVETEMDYVPLFSKPYIMGPQTLEQTIVTRPRFARSSMIYTNSVNVDESCLTALANL